MSNMGKLMRQATRLQQQMEKIQSDLSNRTVEGTSGGGAVKVVAKCDQTLVSVKIDPAAVNPADVSMLEDLVLLAANNALNQAKETANREMGAVTSGFSIPGLV